MAEKSIVSNSKLIAIADAIRGKTGKSDKISLDNMPTEIEGIQSGSGDTLKMALDARKSAKYLFDGAQTLTNVDEILSYNSTSSVTNTSYMFQNCSSLITTPALDTSSVTNMEDMFSGCTSLTNVGKIDTSNVKYLTRMFQKCESLVEAPEIDASNANNLASLFYNCKKLVSVSIKNFSSIANNINNMFCNCESLTEVPLLDTSGVTEMNSLFSGCKSLTNIPEMDTSNVTSGSYMFSGCKSITAVPKLNFSKMRSTSSVFSGCSSLIEIPELDTSSSTNMSDMFRSCDKLETIHGVDANKVTSSSGLSWMFANSSNIKNLKIKNIRTDLIIGSNSFVPSFGESLTLDSLIGICKECIKHTSNVLKLRICQANKDKLDSVYVKFVDPSVTEIAVGEKGEVEVCESTDEGAMTMDAYMILKNWSLTLY